MDKDYLSIENQEKRNALRKALEQNKARFKQLTQEGKLNLKSYWHISKKKIELSNLRDDCHKDLNGENDYTIYKIEREELFRILDPSFKNTYVKSKIWENHDEDKITKVMVSWENEIKLIPPVLISITNNKFFIQDGKHRFATTNFLELSNLPIIVLNNDIIKFLELADKDKISVLD